MRTISIFGDSVSTFEGFNPPGYAVFYDRDMQMRNGLSSVEDTWWYIVLHSIDASLCANNSYSGSRVSGDSFPSACSDERIDQIRTYDMIPEGVLIYLGYNDFGYGVDIATFSDAYSRMIHKLMKNYPHTTIVCGTLLRTYVKEDDEWSFPEFFGGYPLEEYNETIRQICHENGVYLADIGKNEERCETLDGAHPTKRGHSTLAKAWIDCLSELKLIEGLPN